MTEYGLDLSAVHDLDATLREVSETQLMLEAIARRITTPRGSAIDAPDDGIDVRDFLSASLSREYLASIQMIVRAEILKEERVLEAIVLVTFSQAAKALSIRIQGYGADGPFRLTIAVSAATIELLEG